ncbi:MAG TPA: alpha-2-macroglobulin, partial [Planctomycetota bacterium]|nr:alpha-2-macroglobulin [Planctomycetota bacterium]
LLQLPVAAIVTQDLAGVALRATAADGVQLGADIPASIALQNGRGRVLLPITVGAGTAAKLTLQGKAGRFADLVEHTLRIAPRGFPHHRSAGGTVEAGKPSTFVLSIPTDAVPGSGHVTLKVYPSPLTALTEGLNGILQEPHGCFEQASSSNYPNTLVLTLLEANGDDIPAVAARARELLPRGYAKITGYECKQRGYEWFGGDPGHEALTAYGLLQFHDMAKVYAVDAGMVDRTRQWLLARRDGKGSFRHNEKALDRFGGASQQLTDAYVVYALLQAGTKASELETEIAALIGRIATKDPYEQALIACALHLAKRPEVTTARQRLAELQGRDGSLHGTTTSITKSGGRDLIVETTGFAVLAWLPDAAFQNHVRSAVGFLQTCRGGSGTFGATQATIVALRALTEYAAKNRTMREAGTLRVFDGGTMIAERAFAASDVDAIAFDLWNKLTPGEHTLRVEVDGGGSALPYACEVTYHAEQPADDPVTKVSIATSLRAATVTEGDTVALDVEVRNRTAEGQPMTLAIIGLPAGVELPTRVLEDLQKAEAFAFWELKGRELALYWRDLAPDAIKKLTLDLVARIPGQSTGPASRTYLYYTPQQKRWAAPLRLEVKPAK